MGVSKIASLKWVFAFGLPFQKPQKGLSLFPMALAHNPGEKEGRDCFVFGGRLCNLWSSHCGTLLKDRCLPDVMCR